MTRKELNSKLNHILLEICSHTEGENCEELKRHLYNELSHLKINLTGMDGFKDYALSAVKKNRE